MPATCPTCQTQFRGDEQFCPRDGTPLQALIQGDRFAGRVLSGRYRLIDRLGQGGMGAVYRAHHILMDKPVAVKVLRQELASDAEAVARFHREARSASRLDHEHIIRVTDFGQSDDGLLFLVMELLDGESLADELHRGRLSYKRAAQIGREVALGLAHAHEQGIIHRDLKPENIMLSKRGKSGRQMVKVLDFGLAKLMHDAAPSSDSDPESDAQRARMSLTRTGVVFGTPEYMSPEQAEGLPLDQRTDLYALGVMCYQMVTGDVPFSAPTVLALITKTVQEIPQAPRQRCPGLDLPAEFEELILRCLEKSPEQRPQSAEEVVEILERLSGSGIGPPVGEFSLGEGTPAKGLPPPESSVAKAFAPTLATPVLGTPPVAGRESGKQPEAETGSLGDDTEVELPRIRTSSQKLLPTERSGPREEGAPKEDEITEAGDPLELVPRPRRTGVYALVAVLVFGLAGLGYTRYLRPPATTPPEGALRKDALQTARELLSDKKVDEALIVLAGERARNNSAALQRLLGEAYVAKHNRLRALGHMYAAVALSASGSEEQESKLSLAHVLSHLGHTGESCKLAEQILSAPTDRGSPLIQRTESLKRSLRCAPLR